MLSETVPPFDSGGAGLFEIRNNREEGKIVVHGGECGNRAGLKLYLIYTDYLHNFRVFILHFSLNYVKI